MTYPLAPTAPRTGRRGMVSAADQLAASAGVAALDLGGSAADAAVAAAAVMAVTSPHLCGLGGDMLAMVSSPGAAPESLLGVGRAGSGSDAEGMRADGLRVMPLRGDIRSVPVPGAVDGWLSLHERYGKLPIATVLSRAIELADQGFAASMMLALASHLVAGLPGTGELCPDGPLEVGATVRLLGIARTLRAIADLGRDGFYNGEFGDQLRQLGHGVYQEEDFAHTQADWYTPLQLNVWGHDLWTMPPPSQGYLTLAGAWVAEHSGLGDDPLDPAWAHLLIESARAVGHDRPDVLFDGADGTALLGTARLQAAADRIAPGRAAPGDVMAPDPATAPLPRIGDGDTTHLCAIDADGLGISLTQSNALDFGSHLVAGSTGVFLHNRGVGFSLEPGHPAELTPGRRPPHTLSPMLATQHGRLTHLVGAMGGDAQPQIILQLLARLMVAGQDPSTAIAAARFALDAPSAGPFRLWWGDDLTVLLEAHAPAQWMERLPALGHLVRPISAFDPTAVGCAQIITAVTQQDGETRHYIGATDPRSPEGAAVVR